MGIKKIIKEEMKITKYSELGTWDGKPDINVLRNKINLKVERSEIPEILSNEYDNLLREIDELYLKFAEKVTTTIGLLPEDLEVVETSFRNNHTYIKNGIGSYEISTFDYGLDDHIFDSFKTMDTLNPNIKYGTLNGGDDFSDIITDLIYDIAGDDDELIIDLKGMLGRHTEKQFLDLFYNEKPEDILIGYMEELNKLKDDDMTWMYRGHNE